MQSSKSKYPECDRIRSQLGGCGTSTGANDLEADGAITKKGFVNKLAISRKKAKETRFFLRTIVELILNWWKTKLITGKFNDQMLSSKILLIVKL